MVQPEALPVPVQCSATGRANNNGAERERKNAASLLLFFFPPLCFVFFFPDDLAKERFRFLPPVFAFNTIFTCAALNSVAVTIGDGKIPPAGK